MSDSNQHPQRHTIARAAIAAGLLATPLLLPSPAWAEEAGQRRLDTLPTSPAALAAPMADDMNPSKAAAPDEDEGDDLDEEADDWDSDDLDEDDEFWDDYDDFDDYDEDEDLSDDYGSDDVLDEDWGDDGEADYDDPYARADFEQTYVAPPGEPPAEPTSPTIPTTRRNPDGSKPQQEPSDQPADPGQGTPPSDGETKYPAPADYQLEPVALPDPEGHEPSDATEEEIEEARHELEGQIKAAKEANEAYRKAREQLEEAVKRRQELVDKAAQLIDDLQERVREGAPAEVAQQLYALELSELLDDDGEIATLVADGAFADYRNDLKDLHQLIGEYRSIDIDTLYRKALEAHAHATEVYDGYLVAYDHYYDLLLWEDEWVPWPGYRYSVYAAGDVAIPKGAVRAEPVAGASSAPRHMAARDPQERATTRLPETADASAGASAQPLAVLGSLLVTCGSQLRRKKGRHFAA